MDEERFDFENLKVYQKALEYVDFVYEITKDFPKTEMFSLTDQFKRASISICLNIVEGSGGSKTEFSRFLKIARRSVRECVSITEISYRQKFIDDKFKQRSRRFCVELSKMVNGLMKSLKGSEKGTPNSELCGNETPNSELRTQNFGGARPRAHNFTPHPR